MSDSHAPLRVTVLLGSLRAESNSARVAGLVVAALAVDGAVVDVVDPRRLQLCVPGAAGDEAKNAAIALQLKARVTASDLILLVTPEYDGSYSAVLKILIEHLGYPSVLQGRAVALLGVASGAIGALKALEHLRGICLHIGALVMPQAQSIAVAHRLFDAQGVCTDVDTMRRCGAFAKSLSEYARWVGGSTRTS